MSEYGPTYIQYGDGPWEGGLKWVKVKDRDEVGKVVDGGKNIGYEYCCGVLFRSTGQVCYYRVDDVTRCDEQGNTAPPGA
jgi:hypothetical protein